MRSKKLMIEEADDRLKRGRWAAQSRPALRDDVRVRHEFVTVSSPIGATRWGNRELTGFGTRFAETGTKTGTKFNEKIEARLLAIIKHGNDADALRAIHEWTNRVYGRPTERIEQVTAESETERRIRDMIKEERTAALIKLERKQHAA
jgi:hypothetical protein